MIRQLGFLVLFVSSLALAKGVDFSTHATWDTWLKKNVTMKDGGSTVNYRAAKSSPGTLPEYLKALEAVTSEEFGKWSDEKKMAFLLNAYNAFTVKLILDNYPVKSIKDIGGLFSSPWKKKFFKLFGEERNLDYIEHERLRKDFTEPRIHFGVVCASKGCPPLWNEAYRGDKLEAQLERGAKSFLTTKERNYYDAEKNKLRVSKIFDWFSDDFKKKSETVQNFIAPRMAKTQEEEDKMRTAEIDALDYDWTLNEAPAPQGKG